MMVHQNMNRMNFNQQVFLYYAINKFILNYIFTFTFMLLAIGPHSHSFYYIS